MTGFQAVMAVFAASTMGTALVAYVADWRASRRTEREIEERLLKAANRKRADRW